uniref:AlNc14C14G1612 protein n=1 Tax=Albugo laibachii Nc14 TaxID=890382 RepID=F0W3U7_9STRA|nr:AlNc14C14G1612 [Albugo laibachii Nc14]|eukprot:CCA15695.1 AlNc14C14G1612 [Albugo laibachii Nc14]
MTDARIRRYAPSTRTAYKPGIHAILSSIPPFFACSGREVYTSWKYHFRRQMYRQERKTCDVTPTYQLCKEGIVIYLVLVDTSSWHNAEEVD